MADADFQEAIRATRTELTRPTRRVRSRDLLSPLLEHGIVSLLWLGGGWWVFRTYDDSIVGLLGVAMMLWGGLFHGIVLIGTYGFALYALLFRREWFASVAERRHIERVNRRIERDLETGEVDRAMDRLHGLLCSYPDNLMLRWRLAVHLIAEDRKAEAGRHLVLQSNTSEEEREAVAAFCTANGHDPFQILRKVVRGMNGADLPRTAREKLRDIHHAITRESDRASQLYYAVEQYLNHSFRSRFSVLQDEYRSSCVEMGLLLSVLLVLFIWKSV